MRQNAFVLLSPFMYKLYRLLTIAIFSFGLICACSRNPPQPVGSQAVDTSNETVKVVNHAMGKTEVPINPQRVVVLDNGEAILSLGVRPVGSTREGGELEYLKNRLEGIESVGHADSPNLERIVALKPDLILGTKFTGSLSNYELLSQIAPTVIANVEHGGEWKQLLNKYAEALGKTDRAEQIMRDYNARIEDFQAQMGDRLKTTEVSIFRSIQDRIVLYLEDSFCGVIVTDAGLSRPSAQANVEASFSVDISKELLQKADGDVIFVWTYEDKEEMAKESQTALKELKADPLWSKLNAVQQDKVYEVPGYWIGYGPTAANLVLDDLFEYLVEKNY